MDNDRIKSTGKKIAGSVEGAEGEARSSTGLDAQGHAQTAVGKLKSTAGKTGDALRDSVKK